MVGHELQNALGVRLAGLHRVVVGPRAVEEDRPHVLVLGDVYVRFGHHSLEVAVLLDELQPLLRSDPGDARVEVGSYHDADVYQLLPGDTQVLEHALGVHYLRLDILVDALAGDLPPPGDG